MPRLHTTYGFEAEFHVNANAVQAKLYERGLASDRSLHEYHCNCDHCQFENGFPFRGQTDSSCSGEIISDIASTVTSNGIEWMTALSDAAVEVDAEPGYNSGFHVHVGIHNRDSDVLAEALWQILKWEPVLERVAGGRWPEQRAGMNTTIRDCLWRQFEDDGYTTPTVSSMTDLEGGLYRDDLDAFKYRLLAHHGRSDRHSNLNISQRRAPTWEFRLWNSTRSAWRMEMFAGLSVALLDSGVLGHLAVLTPPQRRRRPSSGIADLALAVADGGHSRTAELLTRQAAYLDDRAEFAPALLTVL